MRWCLFKFHMTAVLTFLNFFSHHREMQRAPTVKCVFVFMCVSTECTSNSRLVGTFLSVCALTVLCGLVVVAVSRLVLQKRGWSPGDAIEDADYHCTVKVCSQRFTQSWMWS